MASSPGGDTTAEITKKQTKGNHIALIRVRQEEKCPRQQATQERCVSPISSGRQPGMKTRRARTTDATHSGRKTQEEETGTTVK